MDTSFEIYVSDLMLEKPKCKYILQIVNKQLKNAM